MPMNTEPDTLDRREFAKSALASVAVASTGPALAFGAQDPFTALRRKKLNIGILIFPRIDQIDFTGPFEVLARIPDSTLHVIGTEPGPIKDHKGLILTAESVLPEAPALDVLQVPGGPGQEALMDDEAVLSLIRRHVASGGVLFSVCTGALICGAAGVLRGRRATTHWAAFKLLHYFGVIPVDARVVIDHNIVSAAGITSGIDGALTLAALLRGDTVAQEIQLDIQYAPEPPFHAGNPKTAPQEVLSAVIAKYQPLTEVRERTARRIADRFGS